MAKPLGNVPPLFERAKTLLCKHYDALADSDRDYLCSISGRQIVFGTEFQKQRIKDLEAQFNNPTAKQQ